ncbi:LysR substrate-binding domain-containing protein [Propionivibrio soli]|uniref:LysR substrate-binding domain-containing protein n=1 Tax=Propionivibrio soli TaxID=2976531 RepID=UPI0021E94CE6|nr:LysR substrate-binding domain-containing protein [Propionivibrio soli]
MSLRQFRYFVTTAEELHFARAAERLGIAQPALSQQIRALEERLGARLFHRANRRVELTEAGNAFLREARATIDLAAKAERIARDTARGEAGRIDIGIVGSVVFDPDFPHLLNEYRNEHPGIQLSLHEMRILTQIEAVHNRQLDMAIIRTPLPSDMPDNLDCFTLSTQKSVAVLPSTHPLAHETSIHLRDLAEETFVAFEDPPGAGMGEILLRECRGAGFEPLIAQRVCEIGTLISLVGAGFGVSLVAETISHLQLPGVCYLPLEDTEARSQLAVIHRRFERSAAVAALLERIRASSKVPN